MSSFAKWLTGHPEALASQHFCRSHPSGAFCAFRTEGHDESFQSCRIMSFYTFRPSRALATVLLASAIASSLSAQGLTKVTIGHTGSSCQAPVFIAQEKGFYAEEGLEVSFVQGDWNFLREGLAFGKVDAAQGLVMNFLKPLEQGFDVRFTAGIHRGCIYLFVPKDSPINSAADLKGKRVGVPGIGSSQWIFAQRAAGGAGLDVKKDVEWRSFPNSELKLALDKGEVDAIAVLDPTARIIYNTGTVKTIVDQGRDEAYKDEYCCVVVVGGRLARRDPDTAARITRAILKASKWVDANPQEAGIISVEKKYVGASVQVNAQVFETLDYIPSVVGGKDAVHTAAKALQDVGILLPSTRIDVLVDKTFLDLPGVTDEWLQGVSIAKVEPLTPEQLRSYLISRNIPSSQILNSAEDLCGGADSGGLGQTFLSQFSR